jgi:proteic killer suppression protein
MDVEFADKELALVETDRAAETKLAAALIESLRDKLNFIRAAADDRSLRNWRSLHYEKLEGRGGERSIRLNKQWRLIFTIDTECNPPKITVLSVEDYH